MAGRRAAPGVTEPSAPPADVEREALNWLFRFADWERGVGWNKDAAPDEAWKLGRTRALLDLAGAPDRDLRIVHIAGTKGKGSTAAYLESIARAAGWRTGLYTQPHLHRYRERIRLDGKLIDAGTFARQVDGLRDLVRRLGESHPDAGAPTTFELTTVLAVLAFAEAAVDVTIVEVGLGGRLDATNALDTDLSVITPIGLDHQQILGRTLAAIASEKAGIIRVRQRVVSARQRAAAARVVEARCRELEAPLEIVPPLRAHRSGTADAGDVSVPLSTGEVVTATLGLAAPGQRPAAHQRQNAAVAVAAAEALRPHGLPLTASAIQRGLAETWLPARQEIVSQRPSIVVDAAHNVDSARALAATLRQLTTAPIWLVLGMLGDKDAGTVARILARQAAGGIVARPASPRGLPAADLARAWRAVTDVPVEEAPSVAAAVERARERAGSDGAVVVAGSFVTAAEARAALGLEGVLTYEDHLTRLGRMSRAES